MIYVFLVSNQFIQTLLASNLFFKIDNQILISPGSAILFSTSIFAALLIYIKEGVKKTRKLMFSIAVSNLFLLMIVLITKEQVNAENFVSNQVIKIFLLPQNIKIILVGTLVLVVDILTLIIIFDFLRLKMRRLPMFLIILTSLLSIMILDALIFDLLAWGDSPQWMSILKNNLIGKIISGIFLSTVLYAYVKFKSKNIIANKNVASSNSVFNILTYNEKYDILKREKEHLELINKDLNEHNESKKKLFSVLSHDLKSPFNAIVGFSELLKDDLENLSQDEIKEYVNYICISSKNGLDLFNNLLEWSKLQMNKQSFRLEHVNMNELVLQNIEFLRPNLDRKRIKINFKESDFFIEADRNMLNSIVQNLISNAIKFSFENNKIDIQFYQSPANLTIKVTDYGIGISQENINKLFKDESHYSMYGTKNEKGTGLGLILCKEFVTIHQGEIWVESKAMDHTSFYVRLPKKHTNPSEKSAE
jgi:signal transduction histidine kinase